VWREGGTWEREGVSHVTFFQIIEPKAFFGRKNFDFNTKHEVCFEK
jgi:hypothetical protein